MNIVIEPISLIYSCKGELTEETREGVFKVKPKLSAFEILECDRDRRELLGNPKNDEQVSVPATNLAICLSQLRARIVDGPAWYKDSIGLRTDFLDENVIFDLFKKVVEIETQWKENLKKTAQEAKDKLTKENG